jgi:signal transduction histidine kinase
VNSSLLSVTLAFSLGVHLLAYLALGLVRDRNPRIESYRWFVGAVAGWLAFALLAVSGVFVPATAIAAGTIAHLLPVVLYLALRLPVRRMSRTAMGMTLAAAAVLLPFTIDVSPAYQPRVEVAYYTIAWVVVAILLVRTLRTERSDAIARRRTMTGRLLAAATASIGLLVLAGATAAIALVTAAIQGVVLYATVRLSLYEGQAIASRTGALAADAAELERWAVAGEIAAMVAHEVRNPLTGVRSLAQRLADDEVADDRRRQYAGVIVREVDRVERIVGALLGASATRDAGRSTLVRITELFDDVSLLVAGRFRGAGVLLRVEAPAGTAMVPREPAAQVLLNLLLNAVLQAPGGSEVTLEARIAGAELVELVVVDRGPGVAVADRERIFEPFHSGTGGSGLGLAVARRLCEEQRWRLVVSETPGGGATFRVMLPPTSNPAQT